MAHHTLGLHHRLGEMHTPHGLTCILGSSTLAIALHSTLLFYLLFEVLLYLMYLYLVGLLLHARAQHALLLLVAYTAAGSGGMMAAFLLQYTLLGVSGAIPRGSNGHDGSHEVAVLVVLQLALATKLPCYPLHGWLLDAHVESSTSGSVLLAGVYLKIGTLA